MHFSILALLCSFAAAQNGPPAENGEPDFDRAEIIPYNQGAGGPPEFQNPQEFDDSEFVEYEQGGGNEGGNGGGRVLGNEGAPTNPGAPNPGNAVEFQKYQAAVSNLEDTLDEIGSALSRKWVKAEHKLGDAVKENVQQAVNDFQAKVERAKHNVEQQLHENPTVEEEVEYELKQKARMLEDQLEQMRVVAKVVQNENLERVEEHINKMNENLRERFKNVLEGSMQQIQRIDKMQSILQRQPIQQMESIQQQQPIQDFENVGEQIQPMQ